jgi:hypothetical protein
MMDGNKKKRRIDMALNKSLIAIGAFTILEDPVVTVKLSKIPAVLDDKKMATKKKIAAKIKVAGFFNQYFNSCLNIVENIF